jgi:hypothetical protein
VKTLNGVRPREGEALRLEERRRVRTARRVLTGSDPVKTRKNDNDLPPEPGFARGGRPTNKKTVDGASQVAAPSTV